MKTVREQCFGWAIGDRVEFIVDNDETGIRIGDTGTIVNIHDNHFRFPDQPKSVMILVRTDKPLKRQVIFYSKEEEYLKYIWDEKYGMTFSNEVAEKYFKIKE